MFVKLLLRCPLEKNKLHDSSIQTKIIYDTSVMVNEVYLIFEDRNETYYVQVTL